MRSLTLLGRALLAVLVTTASVVVLTRVLLALVPGDAAEVLAGPGAAVEDVAVLRRDLGLDQPVPAQVRDWFLDAVRGDLGNSFVTGEPVASLLLERLAVTAWVAIPAWVLSILVGMTVAAGSSLSPALSRIVIGLCGVPDVVVAVVLVALMGSWLAWLPPVSLVPVGEAIWQHPSLLVLPIASLTLPGVVWTARSLRGPAADIWHRVHVQEARHRGLRDWVVARRHVLPALVPATLQTAAPLAGGLVAGAVVVERLVALPGLGDLLAVAVETRDLPLIQGTAMLLAAMTSGLLAVADGLSDRWREWAG